MSNINNMVLLSRRSSSLKQVFQILVLFVILPGCSKTDEPGNLPLLKGTWVNTRIDEMNVETNRKFIMELADEKEYYSVGVVFDTANKKWIDRRAYDYSLSDDRIMISGTDVLGNGVNIEMEIISVNSTDLVYRVNLFKYNGVEIPDNKTYTLKKVSKSLNDQIIGTWYGKATSAGSTDTDYHYWNYLPDGSYEYYYREAPGSSQWIKKEDNEGRYYLYDNLLATNWSNDIFSGVPGLDYECWEIDITGNRMKWTGYRDNGKVTSYEMERVAAPPAFFKSGKIRQFEE